MKYDEFMLIKPGERDKITADHLVSMARLSYEQEVARYDSLTEYGNRLLTSISIVSAALSVLLNLVVENDGGAAGISGNVSSCQGPTIVLTHEPAFRLFVAVVALALVGSFISSLIASRRFKYRALVPPDEMAELIRSSSFFPNATIAALHFCTSIQASYDSCYERNERIRKCLSVSMTLLIIAIVASTVGGLVLLFR